MRNINQEIDEIIVRYHLDKHYPDFQERCGKSDYKSNYFLNFLPWKDDYNDINSSLQEFPFLMGRVDTTVLEVDHLLIRLAGGIAKEKRKECLERLIFLVVYKRNFLLAEEMVQELLQDFPEEIEYENAWSEISILIESVKKELKKRKSQDILGIWLDAVSYEDINEIPYLYEIQEKDEHTISFTNAYTMTPCTNPTFALIMTGKKRIDDSSYLIEKIDESNSEILSLLKENNISCKFLSGYWKQLDESYKGDWIHHVHAPCSEMLWDMVCNLIAADSQMFIFTHIFSELHDPYASMNQRTIHDCTTEMRRLRGRQDVERQLRYYLDFFGTNAIKIYFSDHGDNWLSKETFHTVLEIQGRNFQREKIDGIFSYTKFPELFKQLILKGKIDTTSLISYYAEIQEVPLYNKNLIGKKIRQKDELYNHEIWGYKGIIDHNYTYLYYGENDNQIWESLLENDCKDDFGTMFFMRYNDISDQRKASSYRKLAKKQNGEFWNSEKSRYSRYLKKVAENAMPKHIKKLKLIHELFATLSGQTVAFRGGGVDTGRICSLYKKDLKKIGYIIDNNQNCQCSGRGIPIISSMEMFQHPIDVVILASKKYENEFRKEALGYPSHIQVVDVYQYLKENGIVERCPFYFFQPREEDYEVEFPFGE